MFVVNGSATTLSNNPRPWTSVRRCPMLLSTCFPTLFNLMQGEGNARAATRFRLRQKCPSVSRGCLRTDRDDNGGGGGGVKVCKKTRIVHAFLIPILAGEGGRMCVEMCVAFRGTTYNMRTLRTPRGVRPAANAAGSGTCAANAAASGPALRTPRGVRPAREALRTPQGVRTWRESAANAAGRGTRESMNAAGASSGPARESAANAARPQTCARESAANAAGPQTWRESARTPPQASGRAARATPRGVRTSAQRGLQAASGPRSAATPQGLRTCAVALRLRRKRCERRTAPEKKLRNRSLAVRSASVGGC